VFANGTNEQNDSCYTGCRQRHARANNKSRSCTQPAKEESCLCTEQNAENPVVGRRLTVRTLPLSRQYVCRKRCHRSGSRA
jgi:hypothetical protein